MVRLSSTYHYPAGPQLLGLPDVGAYLSYLTNLQIEAGFPLVNYPLNYEFIASGFSLLIFSIANISTDPANRLMFLSYFIYFHSSTLSIPLI